MKIKEDHRKILIGKRRSGKTTKLINICLKKIQEGYSVLYTSSFMKDNSSWLIDMFRSEFRNRSYGVGEVIYNAQERLLKFANGGTIKFTGKDQLKGVSYDPRKFEDYFKVYDEEGWDSSYFDLISINGELYDE
jgi:hypothetical protein